MRPHGMAPVGIVLAALAWACCGGSESPAGDGREPIQGGAVDAEDPAVGLVVSADGAFRCTGTLVAPDVVLTAGHCVQAMAGASGHQRFYLALRTLPPEASQPKHEGAPSDAGFDGMEAFESDASAVHPSYAPADHCPAATFDVALLHLDRRVERVKPIPTAGAGGPPEMGTVCEAAGYGIHVEDRTASPLGKRKATVRVIGCDAHNLEAVMVDGIPDHGDSGGPLMSGGTVVGVVRCHNDAFWPLHRKEFFTRVDAVAGWISETMAAWSDRPCPR